MATKQEKRIFEAAKIASETIKPDTNKQRRKFLRKTLIFLGKLLLIAVIAIIVAFLSR